jgi:hypothetical protein
MPDDLTDAQIALLCGIGEFDPSTQAEDKRRDLNRLISGSYVERAGIQKAFAGWSRFACIFCFRSTSLRGRT